MYTRTHTPQTPQPIPTDKWQTYKTLRLKYLQSRKQYSFDIYRKKKVLIRRVLSCLLKEQRVSELRMWVGIEFQTWGQYIFVRCKLIAYWNHGQREAEKQTGRHTDNTKSKEGRKYYKTYDVTNRRKLEGERQRQTYRQWTTYSQNSSVTELFRWEKLDEHTYEHGDPNKRKQNNWFFLFNLFFNVRQFEFGGIYKITRELYTKRKQWK